MIPSSSVETSVRGKNFLHFFKSEVISLRRLSNIPTEKGVNEEKVIILKNATYKYMKKQIFVEQKKRIWKAQLLWKH